MTFTHSLPSLLINDLDIILCSEIFDPNSNSYITDIVKKHILPLYYYGGGCLITSSAPDKGRADKKCFATSAKQTIEKSIDISAFLNLEGRAEEKLIEELCRNGFSSRISNGELFIKPLFTEDFSYEEYLEAINHLLMSIDIDDINTKSLTQSQYELYRRLSVSNLNLINAADVYKSILKKMRDYLYKSVNSIDDLLGNPMDTIVDSPVRFEIDLSDLRDDYEKVNEVLSRMNFIIINSGKGKDIYEIISAQTWDQTNSRFGNISSVIADQTLIETIKTKLLNVYSALGGKSTTYRVHIKESEHSLLSRVTAMGECSIDVSDSLVLTECNEVVVKYLAGNGFSVSYEPEELTYKFKSLKTPVFTRKDLEDYAEKYGTTNLLSNRELQSTDINSVAFAIDRMFYLASSDIQQSALDCLYGSSFTIHVDKNTKEEYQTLKLVMNLKTLLSCPDTLSGMLTKLNLSIKETPDDNPHTFIIEKVY